MNSTCFESDRCQTDNLSSRIMPLIFSFDLERKFFRDRLSLAPLQRSKKFRLPQCKQLPFFYPDPPNKGSGKSGSCYWAGGWRVVKNKACQKSEKCKNPQAPSQVKKFIFSFFLQGNIRSISPEKMKIIFSEQGARPK